MNPGGFGPSSLAVVLGKNEFHIWIIILSDVPYSYVLLRTFCTLIDIDYVGHMLNIPQFLDPMICQVIIKYHNHATHTHIRKHKSPKLFSMFSIYFY